SIKLRHLIEDLRVVFHRLKPMREAFGDVEHPAVLCRQFHGNPLEKKGRVRPKINNDVIENAPRASDQLCLRKGGQLIMHSTEGPLLFVKRNIALYRLRIEAVRKKLSLTPGAGEITPFVFEPLQ